MGDGEFCWKCATGAQVGACVECKGREKDTPSSPSPRRERVGRRVKRKRRFRPYRTKVRVDGMWIPGQDWGAVKSEKGVHADDYHVVMRGNMYYGINEGSLVGQLKGGNRIKPEDLAKTTTVPAPGWWVNQRYGDIDWWPEVVKTWDVTDTLDGGEGLVMFLRRPQAEEWAEKYAKLHIPEGGYDGEFMVVREGYVEVVKRGRTTHMIGGDQPTPRNRYQALIKKGVLGEWWACV